jgi:hypothetical protein
MDFMKIAQGEQDEFTKVVDDHKGPNLVLVAVAHGIASTLETHAAMYISDFLDDEQLTDELRWVQDGTVVGPGVWVLTVDLEDDGPSDWPGARESCLIITAARRVRLEEWTAYVAGETFVQDGGG